jgi:hypothetical protein
MRTKVNATMLMTSRSGIRNNVRRKKYMVG